MRFLLLVALEQAHSITLGDSICLLLELDGRPNELVDFVELAHLQKYFR